MVYCNQVSERITQTEFVMEKELIGWFDDSMSDEDIVEMINEVEAEEFEMNLRHFMDDVAREELADHAMNFEV